MPELPEVETIAKQLNAAISGKIIRRVEVYKEKSFVGNPRTIFGWEIKSVGRKSKVIEIKFVDKKEMLIVHLKMTGQLIFIDGSNRVVGGHPTADWVADLPSKHTRVRVEFKGGSNLFFNDMRMFGWMKLVDTEKYEKELRKNAPDVIDKEFNLDYLRSVLMRSTKAIKLAIMDQEKIGGMGNIYANDALYLARVLPNRPAKSLTEAEIRKLHEAMLEVIQKGIKYGGASAANYVDTRGLGGTYQEHFLVYKQDGKICKRCGDTIKRSKLGGRGTFFCEGCQK